MYSRDDRYKYYRDQRFKKYRDVYRADLRDDIKETCWQIGINSHENYPKEGENYSSFRERMCWAVCNVYHIEYNERNPGEPQTQIHPFERFHKRNLLNLLKINCKNPKRWNLEKAEKYLKYLRETEAEKRLKGEASPVLKRSPNHRITREKSKTAEAIMVNVSPLDIEDSRVKEEIDEEEKNSESATEDLDGEGGSESASETTTIKISTTPLVVIPTNSYAACQSAAGGTSGDSNPKRRRVAETDNYEYYNEKAEAKRSEELHRLQVAIKEEELNIKRKISRFWDLAYQKLESNHCSVKDILAMADQQ